MEPVCTNSGVQKTALRVGIGRRIGLNSVWLFMGRLGVQILTLLFTVVVARNLGESGMGQFSFIAAVVFVGNVFSTFGLDTLLIRDVAIRRYGRNDTLTGVLLIQLSLSMFFILIVNLGAGLLPNQTAQSAAALRIASFALVPTAFHSVFGAVLRANERMDLYFRVATITAAFQLLAAAILLANAGNLIGLSWVLVSSQAVGAVTAVTLYQRHLTRSSFGRSVSRTVIWKTLRIGSVLAVLMVSAVVYQRLGILNLSWLSTHANTGWYAAAARVVEALRMIPYAFFGAMFPIMARSYAQQKAMSQIEPELDGERVRMGSYRGIYLGLVMLMVIALVFALVLAAPIISLLYGSNYVPSVQALRILALSLLPFAISLKLSFDLVTSGREKMAAQAMLLTLGISAILFAACVSAWGLYGACWATLAAESVHAMALIVNVRRSRIQITTHAFHVLPE